MAQQIVSFFSAHWYLLPVFALMAASVFLLLRMQVMLQSNTAQTIQQLLKENPALCLERLQNNKRLKWLFRKPVILLWELDCYLALGKDDLADNAMNALRAMKLEPQDKLELYQREISFYAGIGNADRAKQARDDLKRLLKEAGADQEKKYAAIMDEADIIIGVYVDRNTGLIKKLQGRAEHTKNDVMRGITQYRIAKLCYFKHDEEMMHLYLSRAEKNLKDTWYAPIIEQAKTDPSILERK